MRSTIKRLGAFSLAVLFGCGGGDSPGGGAVTSEPQSGGTVVVGIAADLQTMNSLVSSESNSREVQTYMLLMPLVRYGADLDMEPWLAESWDTVRIAPDTLALTFHLRRDIFWHDGVRTTAEDVRFTYDRALDPQTAFPNKSDFDLWAPDIEVVDSFTIRLELRPHSDYLAVWSGLPILPAHLLRDVAPAEMIRHPYGTVNPVGNGPFRFGRREPGQEWVFEANPDFPLALGGRPYLDRVVFRVIPEQTTLLTELITGNIDADFNLSPPQVEQVESAAGVRLLTSANRAYTYIGWNTRNPLFTDARVRRALTLAIDRQAIVDALLYGHGEVGISTSTPAHWAFDVQKNVALPHDPQAATRLLAEAGWLDRNRDGVLENAVGRPFSFTLVTSTGNDSRRDAGEIVQSQLRALGIAVAPRTLEWNTLITMLDGSINAQGERVRGFEAVTSGWTTGFRKDDKALFHSSSRNEPYAETGFSDPRIDMLIDTLNVIMDRDQARPLWQEYHRILIEESPYTVLFYTNRLLAIRDRLQGVELDARGQLISVAKWWVTDGEGAAPGDTSRTGQR